MELKTTLDYSSVLSTLDWVIFALVFLVTIASVLFGYYRKSKTVDGRDEDRSFLDLLLMGRQLTLPMFIATLVATWYGGIFGVTAIAFNKGIYNFITQGAFWYVSYLLFAIFIIDKVAKYKAVTLPDLIHKMFGPKSAKLSALFNFFNVLPIAYVISLGLFIQILFGGELWQTMLIGVAIVVLYTLYGGFRAVVFSDIIQFFVMCSGVLIILIVSIKTFGGLSYLKAALPDTHFQPTGGESLATTFVWGFIALSTLVDPNFYQRIFAAETPKTAKKGILFSTMIWVVFDICTTAGAMYARAAIPAADAKQAYLIYGLQILPDGVKGFVLAGILATILSTLDSYLFIAGTTVSYDILPKRFRGKIIIHHLSVISVGFIAVGMAMLFDGNIKSVWKTLGSYSASCMLLPVLYGYLFPKRIRDGQFVFASIIGIISVSYWRNTSHTGFWQNVDELYIGVIATSLGLAFYPLFSKIVGSIKFKETQHG